MSFVLAHMNGLKQFNNSAYNVTLSLAYPVYRSNVATEH